MTNLLENGTRLLLDYTYNRSIQMKKLVLLLCSLLFTIVISSPVHAWKTCPSGQIWSQNPYPTFGILPNSDDAIWRCRSFTGGSSGNAPPCADAVACNNFAHSVCRSPDWPLITYTPGYCYISCFSYTQDDGNVITDYIDWCPNEN